MWRTADRILQQVKIMKKVLLVVFWICVGIVGLAGVVLQTHMEWTKYQAAQQILQQR